jgi:hypothetical protein
VVVVVTVCLIPQRRYRLLFFASRSMFPIMETAPRLFFFSAHNRVWQMVRGYFLRKFGESAPLLSAVEREVLQLCMSALIKLGRYGPRTLSYRSTLPNRERKVERTSTGCGSAVNPLNTEKVLIILHRERELYSVGESIRPKLEIKNHGEFPIEISRGFEFDWERLVFANPNAAHLIGVRLPSEFLGHRFGSKLEKQNSSTCQFPTTSIYGS